MNLLVHESEATPLSASQGLWQEKRSLSSYVLPHTDKNKLAYPSPLAPHTITI